MRKRRTKRRVSRKRDLKRIRQFNRATPAEGPVKTFKGGDVGLHSKPQMGGY